MTDDRADHEPDEPTRESPPEAHAQEVDTVEADALEVDPVEVDAGGGRTWSTLVAFTILPAAALLLALGAGYLKWESSSRADADTAAGESVAAARDTTTAILSYSADSADKELNSARDRLTGSFLEEYTKLVNEVVIPGARQKSISAVAQVPAAASVSANADHAVTLVFVNQMVTVGKDAPTNTASSVRVTLDKVGGRWLVSGFEPV